jgi:hypothetical protein
MDIGEPTKIVGIETLTDTSHQKYVENILKEGLERANAVSTPLNPNTAIENTPQVM